jgi:alpha-D-xyloside xylohydrolase
LQPYIVEAAQVAADEGVPIMRPMMLAYPGDRAARDADLQYLFGPDLLVAPVLEPGGARQVWVPPGPWQPECGLAPVTGPSWVRCAAKWTVSGVAKILTRLLAGSD